MNDDQAKDIILDHLYGELSARKEEDFLAHADMSEACGEELDATRKILTAYRCAPPVGSPPSAEDVARIALEAVNKSVSKDAAPVVAGETEVKEKATAEDTAENKEAGVGEKEDVAEPEADKGGADDDSAEPDKNVVSEENPKTSAASETLRAESEKKTEPPQPAPVVEAFSSGGTSSSFPDSARSSERGLFGSPLVKIAAAFMVVATLVIMAENFESPTVDSTLGRTSVTESKAIQEAPKTPAPEVVQDKAFAEEEEAVDEEKPRIEFVTPSQPPVVSQRAEDAINMLHEDSGKVKKRFSKPSTGDVASGKEKAKSLRKSAGGGAPAMAAKKIPEEKSVTFERESKKDKVLLDADISRKARGEEVAGILGRAERAQAELPQDLEVVGSAIVEKGSGKALPNLQKSSGVKEYVAGSGGGRRVADLKKEESAPVTEPDAAEAALAVAEKAGAEVDEARTRGSSAPEKTKAAKAKQSASSALSSVEEALPEPRHRKPLVVRRKKAKEKNEAKDKTEVASAAREEAPGSVVEGELRLPEAEDSVTLARIPRGKNVAEVITENGDEVLVGEDGDADFELTQRLRSFMAIAEGRFDRGEYLAAQRTLAAILRLDPPVKYIKRVYALKAMCLLHRRRFSAMEKTLEQLAQYDRHAADTLRLQMQAAQNRKADSKTEPVVPAKPESVKVEEQSEEDSAAKKPVKTRKRRTFNPTTDDYYDD